MTEQLEFSGGETRKRHGLVVAGLLVFVALLVFVFGEGIGGDHRLIGLALIGLAAAMAFVAIRHKSAPADLLTNDAGLWFAEWDLTIPWRRIEDCYLGGSRLRPLLVLKLNDPEGFLADLKPREREKLSSSPYIRLPELRIPASAAGNRLLPLRDHVLSKIGKDQG